MTLFTYNNRYCSKLKIGGCLFLYLPRFSMEYWRPDNNKKHKTIVFPDDMNDFLRYSLRFSHLIVTGMYLYCSFCVVGIKL